MTFFDALKDAGASAPAVPTEATESPVEATERVWDTSTTPSGTEIRFSPEPREYQIRAEYVENDPTRALGAYDWETVPSVTQILDVLNKPMGWWGMRIGIHAMLGLIAEGVDIAGVELDSHYDKHLMETQVKPYEELVKERKWTVNHRRDSASDRGTSVHVAFDQWAIDGTMPDPQFFPEHERSYVQGLVNFLTDAKLEPVASEVMVGSKTDKYAGRYDLLAYYGGEEVCTHLTPKKEKREALEPGLYLFDLKTSSGVYPGSHFRQLKAYQNASIECGYETPDDCAVINIQKDGRYQVKVVPNYVSYEDFDVVHEVWKSDQRLKGK